MQTINQTFETVNKLLNSTQASVKLMTLYYGISVDGADLEKNIPNYLENYSLKRSVKDTRLVDGKLIDILSDDIPMIPVEIMVNDEKYSKSVIKVNYVADSSFKITVHNSQLRLTCLELELDINIMLLPKDGLETYNLNSVPLNKYIQVLGRDRISILGFEGCSGWHFKKQCKFCDSCAGREDEASTIPSLNDLSVAYKWDLNKWIADSKKSYFPALKKAFQILNDKIMIEPHQHLHVMAGNLPDVNLEWDYMLELSEVLNAVKPLSGFDSYLNIIPPKDKMYFSKAKKLGYQKLLFSLEVYGENYFKSVCPEKHELIPFAEFVYKMIEAVSFFGKGKVRCNFVLGAQPVETLKEGVEFLASEGVVSDFTIFTPKKGTPWENKKKASLIEVAEFSAFLYKVYKKYDFDGIYCAESSRSCVLNEMLEG